MHTYGRLFLILVQLQQDNGISTGIVEIINDSDINESKLFGYVGMS